MSKSLVKNYVEDLGYEYISASTKEEFGQQAETFISSDRTKSIIFEVFTQPDDESDSLEMVFNLDNDQRLVFEDKAKAFVKGCIKTTKSILRK